MKNHLFDQGKQIRKDSDEANGDQSKINSPDLNSFIIPTTVLRFLSLISRGYSSAIRCLGLVRRF